MKIVQSELNQIESILALMKACALHMRERNIFQWDKSYPALEHLKADITSKSMYSFFDKSELKGVIVMDNIQSPQYQNISLYIHIPFAPLFTTIAAVIKSLL